jgi:hypothetical protein
MNTRKIILTAVAVLLVGWVIVGTACAEAPYQVAWSRQFGTSSADYGQGVIADGAGSVYVAGRTDGSLAAPYGGGSGDAFLRKYDTAGNVLWSQQFKTSSYEAAITVGLDGAGGVYIGGGTEGNIGGTNAGQQDCFLTKYDTAGSLQWSRQIGTSTSDWIYSMSVAGTEAVYVTGRTAGNLAGSYGGGVEDGFFLIKYDASGNLQWSRQIGTTSSEITYSAASDGAGGILITGATSGSLGGANAGDQDVFLAKYDDTSGSLQWTRQIGTSASDVSFSVAADGVGTFYLAGVTAGSLAGLNLGGVDVFLIKYEVPEPASMALLALGGLAILRRRSGRVLRRRKTA